MEMFEVNKHQTPITEELLNKLVPEIRDQFLDVINNVEFVRRLISPKRLYAKDLPRDSFGRIIVDIANPHILEDMDYFRPSALYYKEHGCYTFLKPNPNPNSEYGKWIRQERDRCWNGYIREKDGEWVTGPMYFYLNYCPIKQSKIRKGTKQADRIVDFPEVWEGIYWRFHYMYQARNGGIYNNFQGGNHGAELASRSKSKSYSMASILAHNFILGENSTACKDTTSVVTAYQKEFLIKDGVLNKFISIADFCAEHTEFPRKRLKSSFQEMVWKMGYIDADLGTEKGTLNSIIGVSSKDDDSKIRGKRSSFVGVEEFGCHIKGTKILMYDGSLKNVEDIVIGDKLMGDDNTPRIVNTLYNGIDQLYKVTLSNGDYQIVNSCHPIYFREYLLDGYIEHLLTAPNLINIKDYQNKYYIPKAVLKFPPPNMRIDPYSLGLNLKNKDLITSLINKGYIPENFRVNNPENQLKIIAGFVDSSCTYNIKDNYFETLQSFSKKDVLEDIKFMGECNGLRCLLYEEINDDGVKNSTKYRLKIEGNLSIIPTKIKNKKGRKLKDNKIYNNYSFKVEPYNIGEYYGFTVDRNKLFVLGDLTITHNTFPGLANLYNVIIHSVQEGSYVFGLLYLQGTAGDKDSDFYGAQEIMYNPKGYNMYALPNVFDKASQGKKNFVFFFPGYVNRKGHYNDDGVSDVVSALIEILDERYKVKYNSTDPDSVMKTIAEVPITPSEAIVRSSVNMFPVTDLSERLSQLDLNPNEYDDVYVGKLIVNKSGNIEFTPTSDKPIRDFPHKDNKIEGAIEIYKMPEKDRSGKIFSNRYILSCDPYDDDSSDTMSLCSIYVLDLWTDKIVAEYTGRPRFAEDSYEIARRLCLFYDGRINYENNKKGLFAYFSKMNSLCLLTDTLDFLKDKDMIKGGSLYGNKAKGCIATAPINAYAKSLLRTWLLNPTTIIQKIDGEDKEVLVPNLFLLRSRALIKELLSYNPHGNFDRISSMGMLMLLREDRMILYNGDMNKAKEDNNSSYLGNDPFFDTNYKLKTLTK